MPAQLGAADLVQVGEGDADDESGFYAFAQRNDEGFDHGWDAGSAGKSRVSENLKMKFIFNMYCMMLRGDGQRRNVLRRPL
jgi:hypothetical protein